MTLTRERRLTLFIYAGVMLVCARLVACAAAPPAAYGALRIACVEQAATADAARACFCRVDSAFGTYAGMCTKTALKGGPDAAAARPTDGGDVHPEN